VPAVIRVRSFDPSSQVIEFSLWTSVLLPVVSDSSVVALIEELPFCSSGSIGENDRSAFGHRYADADICTASVIWENFHSRKVNA
jgi:hypothetical protein